MMLSIHLDSFHVFQIDGCSYGNYLIHHCSFHRDGYSYGNYLTHHCFGFHRDSCSYGNYLTHHYCSFHRDGCESILLPHRLGRRQDCGSVLSPLQYFHLFYHHSDLYFFIASIFNFLNSSPSSTGIRSTLIFYGFFVHSFQESISHAI